jgi:tryptophanyl-tRNA synthetase
LTGIKPTGEPHLGNLIGAIRPALELADTYEAMYFIADYHALTTVRDAEQMRHYSRSVASTWIAAGLDTDRITMYRQSDVPETFELAWVLSCVTGKGLMNRAHAYKAMRDRNAEAGVEDLDAGVNMGLYNYPVLMAADILLMDTDVVPVGKDQSQHVEYAADIAKSFNALFGETYRLKVPELVLPAADAGKTLPGTDGRKMSKSYDNTIPLFLPRDALRKAILSIVTDSRMPGEAKQVEGSALFELYQAFAGADETAAMRQAYADGIAWGDAKQRLFERIDAEVAPLRERYEALIAHPERMEEQLREGAKRLRDMYATPFLMQLREAVGLRDLGRVAVQGQAARDAKAALPVFKQYREADGKFHFKLVDGDRVLLLSRGFDSPRDAGQRIAAIRRGGFDGADATLGEGVGAADVVAALDAIRAADAAKA